MKKAFITGLLLLATGSIASFAQSKKVYDDDVYYNSKTAKQEASKEEAQPAETNAVSSDERTYSSTDGSSNTRTYNDDGQYSDAEDDYYYSSRINRFYYPFYNRPYWSSFYNPFSYDPYWVDPYWGYSPWVRPGFSVSFGVGPYWSSYSGWSAWYGCSSFGSYYGYPSYGIGGGYYSGYWNGYYAGLYNNNYGGRYGYRTVTYGPRYSLNANTNQFTSQTGYRGFRREARSGMIQQPQSTSGVTTSNPRPGTLRTASGRTDRGEVIQANDRNNAVTPESAGRPSRDFFGNRDNAARNPDAGRIRNNNDAATPQPQQAQQPERSRGGWSGRSNNEAAPARMEQPRATPMPRQEATPQRSFGGERSGSFGGSRSSGGGSFGGGRSSGGGGGGGGRRGR